MIEWLLFVMTLLVTPLVALTPDAAYQKYTEAERAHDSEVQKKLFNEALTLYLQQEPAHPSSKFCYNIANTYFQLGEYGYAILYYYKALKSSPRDEKVQYNLQIALRKAGVEAIAPSFGVSHNEKIVIALILLILSALFASFSIWASWARRAKHIAALLACLACTVILNILWNQFFEAPEAVVVRPVSLRIDAGEQYAPLQHAFAIPGMKVDMVSSMSDGAWLRVRLPSGQEGYVAKEYVRLI